MRSSPAARRSGILSALNALAALWRMKVCFQRRKNLTKSIWRYSDPSYITGVRDISHGVLDKTPLHKFLMGKIGPPQKKKLIYVTFLGVKCLHCLLVIVQLDAQILFNVH